MFAELALGLSAASSILGFGAQSKAAETAAKTARLNALAARISTAFKVEDLEQAGARARSTQIARAAASGVDPTTGSPAEVIQGTAREIEKEIFRAKYTGSLQEQGAMTEADAYEKTASYLKLAGPLTAGATVLGGLGKLDLLRVKDVGSPAAAITGFNAGAGMVGQMGKLLR